MKLPGSRSLMALGKASLPAPRAIGVMIIVILCGLVIVALGHQIAALGYTRLGNGIVGYAHMGIAWAVMAQIAGAVFRIAGTILDTVMLVWKRLAELLPWGTAS